MPNRKDGNETVQYVVDLFFVICRFLRHFLRSAASAAPLRTPVPIPPPPTPSRPRPRRARASDDRGRAGAIGTRGRERVRGRVNAGLKPAARCGSSRRRRSARRFSSSRAATKSPRLILPRERRVLKDRRCPDVLERLTGLSLGADDLRLDSLGMSRRDAGAHRWPAVARRLAGRDARPRARRVSRHMQGRPTLVAADYGGWHVDYSQHANGFPRAFACDRLEPCRPPPPRLRRIAVDITARVEQLEVKSSRSRAWVVEDHHPTPIPMTPRLN